MSDFAVKTEALSSVSSNLKSISGKIADIASEVKELLPKTKTSAAAAITDFAKDMIIIASINMCAEDTKNLSKNLADIIDLYNASENSVINKKFETIVGGKVQESSELQTNTASNPMVGKKIGPYRVVEQTSDQIVLERVKTEETSIGIQDLLFRGSLAWLNALLDKSTTNRIIIKPKGNFEDMTEIKNFADFNEVSASSKFNVTIVEDGKYFDQETTFDLASANLINGIISDPETQTFRDISVENALAEAKSTIRIGTEENNVHFTIGGEAGSAGVDLATGDGNVLYTDANGNIRSGKGISYSVNADATAIEGKISAGITVNNINIDVSEGIGVDASVGGKIAVTDSGVAVAVDLPVTSGDISVTWDE